MNGDVLFRAKAVCGKCFPHEKAELVQQLHASVSQCHFMLISNYLLSLIMSERKSFPVAASLVDPVKIRPGATNGAKTSEWRRCSPGKHSQRMCLKKKKKKKRLKLQQNSDKTKSSGFLTQKRRKSLIEPELAGVRAERGSGGESHGDGEWESLKTKSQVERQCYPEVVRRSRKLGWDTRSLKIRSPWINN